MSTYYRGLRVLWFSHIKLMEISKVFEKSNASLIRYQLFKLLLIFCKFYSINKSFSKVTHVQVYYFMNRILTKASSKYCKILGEIND